MVAGGRGGGRLDSALWCGAMQPSAESVEHAATPVPGGKLGGRFAGRLLQSRALGTLGRRRMAVIVAAALPFGLLVSATSVVLPLWATQELGFSSSQWGFLNSSRFVGVLLGVLLLGALSDRFGQRRLGAVSLWLVGVATLAMGLFGKPAAWAGILLLGGAMSNAFVNLNTLTQAISDRRQGAANSIYRSVLSATAVVAPFLATALAGWWGGYSAVLLVCTGLMVVSGVVLWQYPGEEKALPLRPVRDELRAMVQTYAAPLANKPLMAYVHLSLLAFSFQIGVLSFGAIRLVDELGWADTAVGAAASLGAVAGLAVNVSAAFVLDRVRLPLYVGVGSSLASVCILTMAATDSGWVTAGAFVAFAPAFAAGGAPMGMWLGRAARPGQVGGCTVAGAFAVHKLITAVYSGLVMLGLGLLEPAVGITGLFWLMGGVSLVLSLLMMRLSDPPRPHPGPHAK